MIPALETVLRCVEADAFAGLFDEWGWSTVVDEHVGAPVVERDLFEKLHDTAGITTDFPIGNAGVVHVYGYLFSTVATPHGYKRDRWNDGILARTLGLPSGAFRLGDSTEETSLQRVTDAALPLLLAPPADAAGVIDQCVDGATTRAVVTCPSPDGSGALISGIDTGRGFRLITAFPVADARAFARAAAAQPPRLRWNAARAPFDA
ncbi:amino acid deaminase [Microbacterium sp. G2-8]|uniref:amino acid deaminase n=1 Tax=Microbacterium sp. G2-8 TaxID=2842454 RepID=UPI001C899337|nr:amino acid deaminase [Microbacterium sp. G2-8]